MLEINLLHIFVFAPLLIWIAYHTNRLTPAFRMTIAVVASGVGAYHLQKALASNHWVNWVHVGIVVPLLLWIAFRGPRMTMNESYGVIAVATGTIAYHAWRSA